MPSSPVLADRAYKFIFVLISLLVFVITAVRSALIPFAHDEAGTFYVYMQSGDFYPFLSQPDAGNHVLNSFLSWICFRLAGDSPFVLRLPNLIALLFLFFAVWKISLRLKNLWARLCLCAFFLLAFNWLSFYSLSRGYGLSMSFLLLGLFYLSEYFDKRMVKHAAFFYLFIQLAVSANLILIVVALLLTFFLLLHQLLNRSLFLKWNLVFIPLHFFLLFFWLKFSLFLNENNALYYGQGESYWQTTFVSLAEMLSGIKNKWALSSIIFVAIGFIFTGIILQAKKKNNFFSPGIFYFATLILLVVGFYLMKIIVGVNFPEDRTALFFYVFFVLGLVFLLDGMNAKLQIPIALSVIIPFLFQFSVNLNFRKHSFYNYETIPTRFYERLVQEQEKAGEKITIGGHRIREIVFAFQNYRVGAPLNLMDPPENMQMNCDYYIAPKRDKQFYEAYYEELDADGDWETVLLRRKEKLQKNSLIVIDTFAQKSNSDEFNGIFEITDTAFSDTLPLQVEIELQIKNARQPLHAWIVFDVSDSAGQNAIYKRIPLNWLRYNWNNSTSQKHILVTGNLPKKIKRMVCCLWNYGKETIEFKINKFQLYQLSGKGVSVSVAN